jgi:1-pyrroline-5-carboxylate dehydrogenase
MKVPHPHNETVLSYAPGSPEKKALKAELQRQAANSVEIPLVIGGRELRTGRIVEVRSPHKHDLVLARAHQGGAEEAQAAVEAARKAAPGWSRTPLHERLAIFLRAADLLSTKYRAVVNAATMLGQSKTAHQAEIDSACELIDFLRWNAWFAERIHDEQPVSAPGMWNQLDARPLEGFVYAITPFNFTAIGGNLPTAPAMMGNVVIWKPAATALLSAHHIMSLLREAGLPDGVINFLPGASGPLSQVLLDSPDLAGIHFTGSTGVFQTLWKQVSNNLERYKTYPRLVGETGGKDFILAHPSADLDALAVAIVRGGYEYQGQKCSAASRIYVPTDLWKSQLRDRVLGVIAEIRQGDVADFRNFMGAVIDQKAFQSISDYIQHGKKHLRVLTSGEPDSREGWFIPPTLVESEDAKSKLMSEEIFGPVVTVHPYRDWSSILPLVDETSPYALTGAVFARDRAAIAEAASHLRHAAGNFYINDKPTGAVVGQQPFGGARASGTNDKAGSLWNLIRWVSPRTIKETFSPPTDWRYAFLGEA